MKYVYAIPNVSFSARLLATKLGLKVTVSNFITEVPTIRYGNSRNSFNENDTHWNHPDAIKICGNSYNFSEFSKKNEIRSPQYIPINSFEDYEYPFLLRRAFHMGGRDIHFIESYDDFLKFKDVESLDGWYYVPFIKSDLELGIHIINNKVLRIFKKVDNGNVKSNFIRSAKMGYHYHLISNNDDNFATAQNVVLSAFEKIGLGFGRADIGYNSAKRTYYIFEINTAPGLNVNTAELYATQLRELIDV